MVICTGGGRSTSKRGTSGGDRDPVTWNVTEGKGKYNISPGNSQKNQLNPSKMSANSEVKRVGSLTRKHILMRATQ